MDSTRPVSTTARVEKLEKPESTGEKWPIELTSFKYFSVLPPELRLYIWRLCLPQCVRAINYKLLRSQAGTSSGLPGERNHISLGISSPPLVARVCREARGVAFERGRLYDNSTRWNASKIWIDPSRDIIYLNDWVDVRSGDSWKLPSSGHVMNVDMNARVLSLYLPWLEGRVERFFDDGLIKIERTPRIIVCADQFNIKIPHEKAVECGLFGLWAEERLVLVDLSDRVLLQRFSRLPHKHAYKPTENFPVWDAGFSELPNSALTLADCTSIDRMNTILQSVEDNWLERLWHPAEDDKDGSVFVISDGKEEGYKKSHPWTINALKPLPVVQVALAFQLFTLKSSSSVTTQHAKG